MRDPSRSFHPLAPGLLKIALTMVPAVAVVSAWGLVAGCNEGSPDDVGPDDTGPDDVTPPGPFVLQTLQDPGTEYRPWSRWWWPGGAVEEDVLAQEIGAFAANGFGGVEIQSFDAALDPNLGDDFRAAVESVGTPAFWHLVEATLELAHQAGLQVDLNLGSGWPLGGPAVEPSQASRTLMWSERKVSGPMELELFLQPSPSLFYTIADIAESAFDERLGSFMPEHAELIGVWAGRPQPDSAERASSPLVITDTVSLVPSTVISLLDFVGTDRVLRWEVPQGRWYVVAVFSGPAGDALTLSAQGPDGLAVDHLNGQVVAEFAAPWLFDRGRWPASHGVFSDSFEFKVDRLYTDGFLREFQNRRGYALQELILLALSQSADSFLLDAGQVEVAPEFALGPEDDRIRWDWRQTVSELFVENYMERLRQDAEALGLQFRGQSYGLDLDVIAAMGATSIPEVETLYAGGSRLFLKLASSAAALSGRPLASAEAFTFILRDHTSTPLKLRASSDILFLSGVNQLVFHGTPYDAPGEYGIPGWTPFSSPFGGGTTFGSTFGPRWEFANWLPEFTTYVARMQALMRDGQPGADLLVVWPFHGFPTSLALAERWFEPLLGGHLPGVEPETREVPFSELASLIGPPVEDPRVTWLIRLGTVLEAFESCGGTWSWINPGSLSSLSWKDGALQVEGGQGRGRYGALLYFDTETIPLRAARALNALGASGARIIFGGAARPEHSPSYGERMDDGVIGELVRQVLEQPNVHREPREDALATLLSAAVEARVGTACGGQQRVHWRRAGDATRLALFVNPEPEPSTQQWLVSGCETPILYDAWNHQVSAWEGTVTLAPYESRVLVCSAEPEGVAAAASGVDSSWRRRELVDWDLLVSSAINPAAAPVAHQGLGDWRDVETLRNLSGAGKYRSIFTLGSRPERAVLEFGDVWGAAVVEVNGVTVGNLSVPPWQLDLGGALQVGENEVVVHLTPPLRNELVAAAAAGDPAYAQLQGHEESVIASGLGGPAVLHILGTKTSSSSR